MTRVGFVGTGSMGAPVAGTLLAAGHPLRVHDRRPEACAGLVAAGARPATTAAEAGADADVVLLSLPSDVEVAQVCLGPDGLLAAMPAGSLLVDLTTVSVRFPATLAAAATGTGVRYVAAPVSQGVDNAALGRLSVFAGGAPADVDACRPVLDRFARTVIHTGDQTTAVVAKLVTNLLWFVNAAALGEALVLGVKGGLALDTLQQVILDSCGTSWVAEHDIPSVYSGSFDPSFTTALCLKDLRLVTELAEVHEVPLELAESANAAFRRAADVYGAGSPELSVVRYLQERSGVSLQTA